MSQRRRLGVALLIGLLSAIVCYVSLSNRHILAADFTFPLRAAQALRGGLDPYKIIQPSGPYPLDAWFYYPLPAALLAWPFSFLSASVAGPLFFGLSSALLAYALTADGWRRLPLFLSVPFMVSVGVCQWTPLMSALALLPWPCMALAACKPNLGLAAFAYRPSWRGLLAIALIGLASLVVFPLWPLSWLRTVGLGGHRSLLLIFPGPLLLLALLRWRQPEARLLLVLAALPQMPLWYDALPLWLIPKTRKASLYFSAWSWLVCLVFVFAGPRLFPGQTADSAGYAWIGATLYLPALGMVFWPAISSRVKAGSTTTSRPVLSSR